MKRVKEKMQQETSERSLSQDQMLMVLEKHCQNLQGSRGAGLFSPESRPQAYPPLNHHS